MAESSGHKSKKMQFEILRLPSAFSVFNPRLLLRLYQWVEKSHDAKIEIFYLKKKKCIEGLITLNTSAKIFLSS